jgi:alpha-1,2-mannosyltransferase
LLTSYPDPIRALASRVAASRRVVWLLVAMSVLGAIAVTIGAATGHQIDFDIYRMGASHVFGTRLYDTRLSRALMGGSRGMRFNYPPFAALLFWPFTVMPVTAGQLTWSAFSLFLLAALIALSIRAARPGWPRQQAWVIAGVALFPAVRLDPALLTLDYGQVNLLITLMVLADLTTKTALPRGVLTGIAAAVKLTPLVFIPFLFLTRQFRAGATALAAFLLCTLGAYVIAPGASRQYWTAGLLDTRRSGNLLYISNQDLQSALHRISGTIPPAALTASAVVIFAIAGLAAAAAAYHLSSPLLGIITAAATALIISPVSWAHHYVWVVPALAWLALGHDRPSAGPWLAALTATLFWAAPIWWVSNPQTGYGGPLTLLAGNSFFLAAVALVAAAAVRAAARLRSFRHPSATAANAREPARLPAGDTSP